MRYYTILQENGSLLIADAESALMTYYDNVLPLPEDYEEGKYIVEEQEIEEEIEVPDYDEEGNPIIIEYEETETVIDYDEEGNPIGSHEITVIKHKQQTHKETITKEMYVLVLNPNWAEESLLKARQEKYNEANNGAKQFLESGNALFEFEEGKHIEATDGNIAKLTAYALAYVTGQLEPTETVVWNTKEDETVELNAEQIAQIVKGLGFVQASVWSVQFPQYIQAIETAETAEEVNAITIEYYSEIPVEEE